MTVKAGEIIDRLQGLLDNHSDETKVDIRDHLNACYYQLACLRPWTMLTKTKTNPGTVLPADLLHMVHVMDNQDYLYFEIGIPQVHQSAKLYNWYRNMSVSTPLLTGSDLATSINGTSVTSVTGGFTAAMVGEFISIGKNQGIYEITARPDANTLTLKDGFRGADLADPANPVALTAQYFEIRPSGTLQMAESDQNGDALTSTTLQIWYSVKPLPVYNDYDPVLLPGDCEALFIKIARLMLETDKYDNDSIKKIGDYEAALAVMKGQDPLPDHNVRPRNYLGEQVRFGRVRRRSTYSIHSGRLW